jgi:hypothetical protein
MSRIIDLSLLIEDNMPAHNSSSGRSSLST